MVGRTVRNKLTAWFHIGDTATSTRECSLTGAMSLYSGSYLWRRRHMKPKTRLEEQEEGGVEGMTGTRESGKWC